MAGTLFGVPLSQQIGPDGRIASGALVYVYAANTSTPASTYSDFSLSTEQAWPLECDGAGRVPSFYVDDGSYRLRITTSTGVELVDEQAITSIGASSGGSGESASVDTSTVFQTGDVMWIPINTTRTAWVRLNGRTIGNGSSGATERANSDTQALFEWYWNNHSDTAAPVSGGRGGSATADFNAAKTITLFDMRTKGMLGLDTMGNSAAGVTGGSSTAADAVGASTVTIALANLPSTTLSLNGVSATLSTNNLLLVTNTTVEGDIYNAGASAAGSDFIFDNALSAATSLTFTGGTVNLGGSGTHLSLPLPFGRVGTFYQKL